jgi:hypothetical protein
MKQFKSKMALFWLIAFLFALVQTPVDAKNQGDGSPDSKVFAQKAFYQDVKEVYGVDTYPSIETHTTYSFYIEQNSLKTIKTNYHLIFLRDDKLLRTATHCIGHTTNQNFKIHRSCAFQISIKPFWIF